MSQKNKRQNTVKVLEREKTQRPRKYKVVFHNDDFTPMYFVVNVLMLIFNRSTAESTRIMLTVHRQGRGVAGTYSREIAETKKDKTLELSRECGFPLMCTIEPE